MYEYIWMHHNIWVHVHMYDQVQKENNMYNEAPGYKYFL